VGADRLANTLAVGELKRNAIVVDLGTATTFDCISAEGVFLGGVIAPGPRAGMERLAQTASKLMQVEIASPERVIGRNTVACLRSGVFYSVVETIDGIVRRILAEWEPEAPLVIGTGGLVELIAPHCRTIERADTHLTLRGLAIAAQHLF
jgi:type III pantothenate kinase